MSSVNYTVEIQYLSSGSLGLDKATSKIGGVDSALNGLMGRVVGFGQTAGDSFFGAMLKMEALKLSVEGAGAVIDFVKNGITGIQQEMENARIAFAGMFQVSGRADTLAEGLEQSQTVLKLMRKDARELPGEFSDIVEIFQLMGQVALRSGMSIREAEKLSAKTMAFGITFGINNNIAGREMSAMISGSAQGRMPLFQKLLGGMEAKAFNAKPLQERIKLITDAFAKYDDSIKMHVDSWVGLTSTLHDYMETLIRMPLTDELFQGVKQTLRDINSWFDENRVQITEWSKAFGNELGNTFKSIIPEIEKIGKHLKENFGKTPEKAIMNLKKLFAGGISLGVGTATGAGIGAAIGGTMGAIGGLVAGPAGAAAGAAGGSILGATAGAGLSVMLMGALNSLIDGASYFHDFALRMVTSIKGHFGAMFDELIKIWDKIKDPFQNVIEMFGGAFLKVLDKLTDVAVAFLKAVNDLLDNPKISFLLGKYGLGGRKGEAQNPLVKAFSPFGYYGEEANIDKKGDPLSAPAHNTYINKVEIQVLSNQDPSRIARLTLEELDKIARNPRTADPSTRPFSRFPTTLR